MKSRMTTSKIRAVFFGLTIMLFLSASARAATIVIQNADVGTGKGFDDATPMSPVGNNTGTTLGQQRLNVFQFAANIWGATLNSSVTITIRANWTSLGCPSNEPVPLGQAGTVGLFGNFPNAPQLNTWHSGAQANALSGKDLNTNQPDITATFNSDI